MVRGQRAVGLVAAMALLASCGGDDGGTRASSTGDGGSGGTTTVGVTPPANGCALRARQDWVLAKMNESYLFPETLSTSLDPGAFATADDYLDALTATARAQRRDRFFTYLTSVAEENAYYNSGATAGIGVRLAFDSTDRLFVSEAYENAPALNAGIDRGAQIVGIGTTATTVRTVSDILASGGDAALNAALDTSTRGTVRVLRVADAGGTRDVTVTSTDFAVSPLSTRYGSKVIDDGGR